jgi:hypothetical protein
VNNRPALSEAATESVARLTALVAEYDAKWSALDFAGVADLWEEETPEPVYIGDEYAMPLIGADELERHWARVAGRLKRASVSSELRSADLLADGFARCVVFCRWSVTGRESDVEHTGSSWITWLVVERGEKYRIFHHMESQVYLDEHDDRDRSREAAGA